MDTSEDMLSPDNTLNILVPTTTTATSSSVTSSHDDVLSTATAQPQPSPSSSSSAFQSGRVVRLHFTCRAQLPMGSFLRVTGSTLWAPGTNALDPTEATPTVEQLHQFDRECHGGSDTDTEIITTSNLYTSSVEMVTTPDTYPIWTTRTPVILIWNRRGSNSTHSAATSHPVLHHYYRYLVVAPGTVRHPGGDENDHSDNNNNNNSNNDHVPLSTEDVPMTVQASTSNEATNTGSTIVMEWEDPFQTMLLDDVPTTTSSHVAAAASSSTSIGIGGVTSQSRNISAVSLNSSVHLASMTHSGHQYRNLPYRTMDIAATTTTTTTTATTMVNIMDHWNHSEDPTFQPYRIREAVRRGVS
jgi:hypothetical protein